MHKLPIITTSITDDLFDEPIDTCILKLDDKKEKKSKKGDKKKGKKRKDHDETLPCLSQNDAFELFERQAFLQESILREGCEVPPSLILSSRYDSAFVFGRALSGNCVGKRTDIDGHIAVFGGSGSGKTTGLAIPTMHLWRDPIFAFDFKGDLIQWSTHAGRKAKMVSMVNESKNHDWWYDPFYFLRQGGDENLVQNARELAHAIIPLPYGIHDPFWIESARHVLTGAIVHFFNLGVGFIDAIIEIKTTRMSDLLETIYADDLAAACVNPDLCLNPKTLAGVSMELHNHLIAFATDQVVQDVLSCPKDVPRKMIRWEDLEHGDIFIRVDQSRVDQWGGIIRLMLVQLIRTLERRPEKHQPTGGNIKPTLLMLDEFPQYGRIDILPTALKILRSKNVTVSIFCQSLADLDEAYGQATRRTMLDNCLYKVILGASDAETQQYFSDLVGTVKTPSRGFTANYDEYGRQVGYGANISESREPIIHPHEFASLEDVVLLHPGHERFCRLKKELCFRKEPTKLIGG